MKTIRYFVLLCAAFITGAVCAQSQKELGQLMRERNEYYFTLSVNDLTEIQTINSICSVDGFDGRNVVCYANQQQYDNLLHAGYQPNLQTPPSLLEEAKMWDGNRSTYEWDSYPTYSQYQSMMEAFPTSTVSGRTCTYMELGTLSSGRKIMGVRINNGSPEGKPKFLYSSTIHGDETTGWILMLRLIDELCTSTDSRIVNLVNNLDIFIFPNTNPDGTYYGGNNTVTGARRYNANSIDMNRNYPDPHSSAHPDGNAYQTETQWFMQLAEDYSFVMAANYHGGAEVVNYPWDNTSTRHADDAWWQYVSREYAQSCQTVSSSYMVTLDGSSNPTGITNGADWYMIGGGRQDYMNGYRQCREVTVECSTTKNPSASTLPNYWNYNHNAMLTYMEQCLNGVHGFVYDASTSQPLDGVTVTVLNHDDAYSKVSTHEAGDFHRPIKGGSYTFKFSKDGYVDETVNVIVADGQRQNLTVHLTPGGSSSVAMNCYEQTMPSSAGTFVMGYLDGSSLVMPTHNNSTTVTSTSATVTPTENGISVEEGTALIEVALTAYGNNGQYYIKYNNRYLARSSMGSSLTWSSSTPTYGRWYITDNGIYVTRNNNTYYLYYDTNSSSFKLSTSSQNNIAFYTECDCPTPPEPTPTYGPEYPWTPTNAYADNMSVTAQIQINGVPVTNSNWEVGAFCGDECRGDAKDDNMYTVPGHPEMGYFMDVLIGGTAGDAINFYLYDQDSQTIFPGTCYTSVTWAMDDEAGDIYAPFILNFVTGEAVTQTTQLVEGWNRFSTYIEVDNPVGMLNMLKVSLGDNAQLIESSDYFTEFDGEEWFGDLEDKGITNEQMYLILVNAPCTVELQGMLANPTNHAITINPGWNRIGFPYAEVVEIAVAFADFQAETGDILESSEGLIEFDGEGWFGDIHTMIPGQGYLYYSNSTVPKTLIYRTSRNQ